MIVVNLERPIRDATGVDVKAFDLRTPVWADEKAISAKQKTGMVQFEAVLMQIGEPVGSDLPVDAHMLNQIAAWDVKRLEKAYLPFFDNPDGWDDAKRKTYGLSVKSS